MLSKKIISQFILLSVFSNNIAYADENKDNNLTLKEVIPICIKNNLELNSFSFDKNIVEAKLLQSSFINNPEFSILGENLGGDKEVTGGSQLTISISQKIELQDKFKAKLELINIENDINTVLYKVKVSEVLNELELAFLELFFLQEKISLYTYFTELSDLTYKTTSEIVKVGKKSPIEETKAKINYLENLKKLDSLKSQIPFYKEKIVLILGTKKAFSKVSGNYKEIDTILNINQVLTTLEKNPTVTLYDSKIKQLEKIIALEELKNKPDLNLNGGYRLFDFSKQGNFSLNTGISVQLPIFNANQGLIKENKLNIIKLESEKKALLNSLAMKLNEVFKTYTESYQEYQTIENKILPEAENVFDKVKEGYKIGKFSYLELLDAQNNLFFYKERKINLLFNYYKALSEINLITSNYSN